jgi:hypothetical protein
VLASVCETLNITPLVLKHSAILNESFCLSELVVSDARKPLLSDEQLELATRSQIGSSGLVAYPKRSPRLSYRTTTRTTAVTAKAKDILDKMCTKGHSRVQIGIILNDSWGFNISIVNVGELFQFIKEISSLQQRFDFDFSFREKPGHSTPSFFSLQSNIPDGLISREPRLSAFLDGKSLVIGWGDPSSAMLEAGALGIPLILAGYKRNDYYFQGYDLSILNTLREDYFSLDELIALLDLTLSDHQKGLCFAR